MDKNIFITGHYEKLKKIAFKELAFLSSTDSIEDIFHDTLLKCITQMELNNITEEEFTNNKHLINTTSVMIHNMIEQIKKSSIKGTKYNTTLNNSTQL